MKIEFQKQFGQGVDPWHEKAKRWAKKQKFPISFLALGVIEYLKKVWTNTKIKNEMASVDAQIKKLHEEWDEEEKNQFAPEIIETPSEVDALNQSIEINYLIIVAVILSFSFSYMTVKFFLNYINKFSLNIFIIYRIIISFILFYIIYF